jgi:hypothetical protein
VPEGWELVNYDDIQDPNIRNSVKKRIDRLYTQLKQHEREREVERQYYRGLEKKVFEIEAKGELKSLEDLADKAKTAFDSGNVEEGTKLLREVARQEAMLVQKHTPKKHVGGQQQPTYQGDPRQQQPLQLSKEAQDLFHDWQSKHDFAKPGHPYQSQAILTMSNLLVDPNWAQASLEEILDQTAKVMTAVIPGSKPHVSVAQQGRSTEKPQPQAFAQQVLGRSQTASTNTRKNTTILDETQRKIARRFFPDLSPDDAYKRYAKNL